MSCLMTSLLLCLMFISDVISDVMSAVMADVMSDIMSDVMSDVMSYQILPGLLLLSQKPHERKLRNGPMDYDRDVDLPTNLRELTCGDILFES